MSDSQRVYLYCPRVFPWFSYGFQRPSYVQRALPGAMAEAACKDAGAGSWLIVLDIWRRMRPLQAGQSHDGCDFFLEVYISDSQWSWIVMDLGKIYEDNWRYEDEVVDVTCYFAQICRHGDFGQETNPERYEFDVLDAARAHKFWWISCWNIEFGNPRRKKNSFLESEVLILNRRTVFMTLIRLKCESQIPLCNI